MSKAILIALLIAGVLLSPAPAMAAEDVSVAEVVELSPEFAGEEISVVGELIGDYGFRDDGSMWTQLNGDAYVDRPILDGGSPVGANIGIGIRMPSELARDLDPPGGYRRRGPVVRVEGVWRYHDPDRQGESYLDVQTLAVVEPGRTLEESANWMAAVLGLVLLGAGGVLYLRSRSD